MPAVIPFIPAIVAAGATVYGAVQQKKSANAAASVDTATAAYNARADLAMAQQLDLDTQQNVRTARAEDSVYLSREAASYAAAGVLATTGSPLHAQITNAGRMEQQIQQQWVNSNQKQQELASRAKVGILEGNAQATADKAVGSLALINGGTRLAGLALQDFNSGVFA
jgi:hypothetical protein